jgi:hypothetical protein
MKRAKLLLIVFLVFQIQGFGQEKFSKKEKDIIYSMAIGTLQAYQDRINLIGESAVTDLDKAKSGSESLLELFVNRQVLLFNDLDPSHKLSEFYEAETYASNIILWYPDGITINMNLGNAMVGEIMQHEEKVFSIDLTVTKSINGNYLNETLNKNNEELTFRIAFGIENKDFTNFRIVGIRNAASNVVVDYSQALKEVNSEDLSIEDLNKIYGEIKSVLQDYTNFLSLLGDPQEATEDKEFYKTSFQKLFKGEDVRIYNDIMPDPQTKLISVPDYIKNYVADYPNGIKNIKINSDSARFGKVMKADDKSFYTYVDANKFFSGSYKGKEIFREMFPLIFKISFNESGKTYNNFSINSVDIAAANFYQDTQEGKLEKKPSIKISPVTRKGWIFSVIGSFGQTSITNKNIESLSLAQNNHQWSVSADYGYTAGIGINYYLNDNISFRSGLELNKNSALFSLNGTFTDSANYIVDINPTDSYNKTIAAENFDSLVTMNYISIPLLFSYTSGKPGQFGFYAEGGTKVSISLNTAYQKNGKYQYMGYYEGDPTETGYRTNPSRGFYTRDYLNDKNTTKTALFGISFYASAGINIPLGYYTTIMVGPEISLGLSDVMSNNKTYSDIFDISYEHQSTKINYFGIRLSLAYKL